MERPLYSFTSNDGTFTSQEAHRCKALYFPLGNERLLSSITPLLAGDSKTDDDHFLLEPVSRIDLANSRSTRNVWLYFPESRQSWSATGVSRQSEQDSRDISLTAGLLWQEVTRTHTHSGIRADILSFVPAGVDPVECMRVRFTNTGTVPARFIPCAAIPLYCRGAQSIRDHRHVTSLLQRVTLRSDGVLVKPTLLFDEAGHHPNTTVYFAAGWDAQGRNPARVYPTQELFCGEEGDLESPGWADRDGDVPDTALQGKEPMAGLRFDEVTLHPGGTAEYCVLLGIVDSPAACRSMITKYRGRDAFSYALEQTKKYWLEVSRQTNISTGDTAFDNWFHWVSIQPTLRKIFGCSFLPDFDYGKGGRGWRDLWQDCLGLILGNPGSVAATIRDNFAGVRMDGSNATIIGKKKGEFIADRNRIARVWMDHGVWPLLTLDLYMQETGDREILFVQAPYFCDPQTHRSCAYNPSWTPGRGTCVRGRSGRVYQGTILEHLLVQNLVQFYNVGEHNHVRLEGADWNDGLDMARERGESVAFSAMYAYNLNRIADLLEESGRARVHLAKELALLLKKCDYADPRAKQRMLTRYFDAVAAGVSGEKIEVPSKNLADELRRKAHWMGEHIRSTEWLARGFFNGYYDNRGRRVEGERARMMLASQVFPVMSGVARTDQIRRLWKSAVNLLQDKKLKGFHLNTDFHEEQHDLGRAFSFVYGDKENGAFFSHMNVMFANALYSRGYVREGWTVLQSIIGMALASGRNRIFPCLPEYFDISGRGMYAYLTGSASWFVLTMVTRVFGVRGMQGDLLIEPCLTAEQFAADSITLTRMFAGRRLKIVFRNPSRLEYGSYRIRKVRLDSRDVPVDSPTSARIPRKEISRLSAGTEHTIVVELG